MGDGNSREHRRIMPLVGVSASFSVFASFKRFLSKPAVSLSGAAYSNIIVFT